ncbi:M16 family metallopeptidase [Amycolatopsis sp. NPDC059021]|uniref:M16 family metallopeptidase n=1 Tax=Amycolatopsis sp. NPDC059021 TaxID=3346704 RepID=UPI00366A73A7
MNTGKTLERPSTAVVRTVLGNGLTVVLAPDPAADDVALSVSYRVGFRSEPEDAAGFAHLLEHLMFEGSENVEPLLHGQRVRALGGAVDARTHQDYTQYFQTVPAEYFELLCFLEADRMRAPKFAERGLRRQLAGIAMEIRQARSRPYGGFPWPGLAPLLYRSFANAHDGYGDAGALTGITAADCHEFFHHHYAPGNAVLAVAGNVEPDRALRQISTWFGGIAARPAPPAPRLAEPALTADSTAVRTDARIRRPALALGYRLPDPLTPEYFAHLVLARYLKHFLGPALSTSDAVAASDASCGFFGTFDALAPDTMIVTTVHDPATGHEAVLDTVDSLLAAAADGLDETRVAGLRDLVRRDHDHREAAVLTRARALGRFETLFGAAERYTGLAARLDEIGVDDVAAAASAIAAQQRAVLRVVPEGRRR